jgi:hypothetical protein
MNIEFANIFKRNKTNCGHTTKGQEFKTYVVGEMASGHVEAADEVLGHKALVDGHHVGHTIARVHHHTSELCIKGRVNL